MQGHPQLSALMPIKHYFRYKIKLLVLSVAICGNAVKTNPLALRRQRPEVRILSGAPKSTINQLLTLSCICGPSAYVGKSRKQYNRGSELKLYR